MFERLKSKTAVATVAALVAALGVGGVAVAQNSGSGASTSHQAKRSPAKSTVPGQESDAADNTAADRDNVQAGDQSGSEQADHEVSGQE